MYEINKKARINMLARSMKARGSIVPVSNESHSKPFFFLRIGNAGKTTLLSQLAKSSITKKKEKDSKHSKERNIATDGIDIKTWKSGLAAHALTHAYAHAHALAHALALALAYTLAFTHKPMHMHAHTHTDNC